MKTFYVNSAQYIAALLTAITFIAHLFFPHLCLAEMSTDGSLGVQTTLNGPDFSVTSELGQVRGTNLFHSFREFSIQSGESAVFSGPTFVENIISRVTGGEVSYINGLLRSTINQADFFLLNPSGVIFGPYAELDIPGSFHAGTADYLKFDDGSVFYADPGRVSVLSVAQPEAFGFLTANPADITVYDSEFSGESGEVISLIGGDLNIIGENRTAKIFLSGGKLQFIAVGEAGEINFDAPELLSSSDSESGQVYIANAEISDPYDAAKAVIIKGGRIELVATMVAAEGTKTAGTAYPVMDIESASQIEMSNGSGLLCFSFGTEKGGDLRIKADKLIMKDASWIDVIAAQQGDGGDLIFNTPTLTLEDYSCIESSSYASGTSGSIQIDADQEVTLKNSSSIRNWGYDLSRVGDIKINTKKMRLGDNSYIETWAYPTSPEPCGSILINASEKLSLENASAIDSLIYEQGNGGDITINTPELTLEDASKIKIYSYGNGESGDILINVAALSLKNASMIDNIAFDQRNGGDIVMVGETLLLEGKSTISTLSAGTGSCGSITINASGAVLIHGGGFEDLTSTGIWSGSSNKGSVPAGEIRVTTPYLELLNQGIIYTNASGEGKSGAITIDADRILMNGGRLTTSSNTGDSGEIFIQAKEFEAFNRSKVRADSLGSGDAGAIKILADTILLDDSYVENATTSIGKGGNINIESGSLVVRNNALIDSDTSGNGKGGNIFVVVDQLDVIGNVSGGSFYNAIASRSWGEGNAGNIHLEVSDTLHLSEGGSISTDSRGTGIAGEIIISAPTILMEGTIAKNPSKISSNCYQETVGQGGLVQLFNVDTLRLEGAAKISVATLGNADAGDIEIDAAQVVSDGGTIEAFTAGGGDGGNILVNAEHLTMRGGNGMTCETTGTGKGGNLRIVADSLLIDGADAGTTGLFASSTGLGVAGAIDLDIGDIRLQNGAKISTEVASGETENLSVAATSVQSFSDETAGTDGEIYIIANNLQLLNDAAIMTKSAGTADAGNIDIEVAENLFSLGSMITTEAAQADGGNIIIKTGNLARFIDGGVTASVGGGELTTGGNIDLLARYAIFDHAYLTANAFAGHGGNIDISAKAFLTDTYSIVDASSELGIDGMVDINAPLNNMDGSLKPLPKEFSSATSLLKEPCEARMRGGAYGSFVVKVRDALPLEPGSLQISPPLEF